MDTPKIKKYIVKENQLDQTMRQELINICNETWPGLSFHFWSDHDGVLTDRIGYKGTYVGDYYYPPLSIHWFEFLVKAVCDNDIDKLEQFYFDL